MSLTYNVRLGKPFIQWTSNNINGLVLAQTTIIGAHAQAGNKVRITQAFVELQSTTGVGISEPSLSIGNNGSFDNICPIMSLAGLSTPYRTLDIPLATNKDFISLDSSPIKVDITTAATGYTSYLINVYLFGVLK